MREAQETSGDETSSDLTGIKSSFDALVGGACDVAAFNGAMIARCQDNPEIVWEVLALLDQYERRGQLARHDFGTLKAQIHAQAFRRPMPAATTAAAAARADESQKAAPSTGKWVAPVLGSHLSGKRHAADTKTRGDRDPVETIAASGTVAVARLAYSRDSSAKPGTSSESSTPQDRRYPEVGTVLQRRFVLEQKLGSGGMGTVFKALDRNRIDLPEAERYVALKVLRADFATRPDAVQRLRQEFLQTQCLSHPGIVNVHDLDADAGIHFFTMELLQGELLSSVLARTSPRRLERDAAETILCELGSALVYAHDRGIQHADLKPGNIMITRAGDLRVLDFGVATPVRREPWIAEAGESFNGVTRVYASCERLSGEAPHVQDDIYSFGCLAYELLAGMHPFARKSALQAREENLKPPRIRGLSGRQWRALTRALAWKRADRQTSLADLVGDLVPERPVRSLLTPRNLQSRDPAIRTSGKGVKSVSTLGALAVLAAAAVMLRPHSVPTQVQEARRQIIRAGEAAATAVRPMIESVRQWRRSAPAGAAILPAPPITGSGSEAQTEVPATAVVAGSPETPTLPETRSESPGAASPPPIAPVASAARAPATIGFTEEALTVLESSPIAKIVVRRRGDANQGASFTWRTIPGTAAEDQDYAAFGEVTETFAPGQMTATILVPIVRDSSTEAAETFSVEITGAGSQARLGTLTRATVYIEDDDSAATGN